MSNDSIDEFERIDEKKLILQYRSLYEDLVTKRNELLMRNLEE